MRTPNRHMLLAHLHALDLDLNMRWVLPARVAVAVEAQARPSDNSTW